MMNWSREGNGQAAGALLRRAQEMLAAAGLQAEQVERCPDPTCPLCARSGRAAA